MCMTPSDATPCKVINRLAITGQRTWVGNKHPEPCVELKHLVHLRNLDGQLLAHSTKHLLTLACG